MSNSTPVVDVRPLAPRDKHATIFRTFDSLESGTKMLLVNDHDPVPLKYQFEAERSGQFTWNSLEQGPVEWRVEIGRN